MECNTGLIDLHIHSTASDGSLSPEQLLQLAVNTGLSAIAITDHDTVAGADAALRHGIPDSLEFITGIEISAAFPSEFNQNGSMHLLGYGIRTDHPELNRLLEKQQAARVERNPQIIEKLKAFGIPVTMDAVIAETGKEEIGRPHIADYLVRYGYAESIDDAFDRLLGKGKPAYVDKFRVDPGEAIALIRSAGGVSVLAHPCLYQQEIGGAISELIGSLELLGLGGIEAYYPGHTPDQTASLEQMAHRFGLLVTGGTDFHGDINPDIAMGTGRGNFHVPPDVFPKLKNALSGQ